MLLMIDKQHRLLLMSTNVYGFFWGAVFSGILSPLSSMAFVGIYG